MVDIPRGESTKGIHDDVDPEKLNGGENRCFLIQHDNGDKGDDCGDVGWDLEL